MLVVHPTIYDGFHTSQVHRIHSRITHHIPFSKLLWILLICQFLSQKKHPTTYVCFSFSSAWASQQRVAVLLFLGFWWTWWTVGLYGAASIRDPWETLQRHRHQTSSVQALLPMIQGRHGQAVAQTLITPEGYTRFPCFLRNYCFFSFVFWLNQNPFWNLISFACLESCFQ